MDEPRWYKHTQYDRSFTFVSRYQRTNEMSEITPDAFSARLETDEELFVIDIRNEDDYEDW